jgi:hypothetical protein
MTEALERQDSGKIIKSTTDQALGIWAKGVAKDKHSHLMCQDPIKHNELGFIQDQIGAV